MKIKLILPTIYDENGKLVKVKKAIIPNLTIFYLAGMVPSTHSVKTLEECIEDINFDEPADLVGISVNTSNAERAYEIAEEYRKRNVPVCMGGVHVTCVPDEAVRHADAIVIGEAEDTWPQLISDFENSRMREVYKSARRDSLINLPFPRVDLINFSKYLRIPCRKSPLVPVQTARGCPYSCDFCVVTKFWGDKMRYRPIEDVIEEIKESNADTFFFTDDNFFSNYQRAERLCEALIPLKVKFFCQADATAYRKPELIKLAARSGCIMIFVGFESVSKSNLKNIKKTFNKPEDYEKLFSICNKYHINVFASFIFGFDEDKPELVEDTVRSLIRQRCSLGAFFPLCPYPGTALYERLREHNRLIDNEWWLRKSQSKEVGFVRIKYRSDQFSGFELASMAMKKFYSIASIIQRFLFTTRNRLLPLLMNISINIRIRKSIASFM